MCWDDCYAKVDDRLYIFTVYILTIIQFKEEYKNLPSPNSAYL
jgi:hypothetical protein